MIQVNPLFVNSLFALSSHGGQVLCNFWILSCFCDKTVGFPFCFVLSFNRCKWNKLMYFKLIKDLFWKSKILHQLYLLFCRLTSCFFRRFLVTWIAHLKYEISRSEKKLIYWQLFQNKKKQWCLAFQVCSFFLALSLKRLWLRGCSEEKGAVEEKPLFTSLFCSLIFLILLPDFFCDRIAEASSKIAVIPETETSCTSEPLQEWSALFLALFFFCRFLSE